MPLYHRQPLEPNPTIMYIIFAGSNVARKTNMWHKSVTFYQLYTPLPQVQHAGPTARDVFVSHPLVQ